VQSASSHGLHVACIYIAVCGVRVCVSSGRPPGRPSKTLTSAGPQAEGQIRAKVATAYGKHMLVGKLLKLWAVVVVISSQD
jgi:hypothetical protein